jgi:hypothetical protein
MDNDENNNDEHQIFLHVAEILLAEFEADLRPAKPEWKIDFSRN